MKVDDITFSLFVGNNLSQAKMMEVEKLLIQNNEVDSSIQASILNHSLNRDRAEEMLGVDSENKLEEILASKDRNMCHVDSREVNKEKIIINSTTMNNKLSKEEILKVQELVVKFNESYNAELSLEENLVKFYLTQRPGTFPEDAYTITNGLKSGIVSFNANLKKALENGEFDYAAELKEIASEMPTNEKYELYVNFLAALQTLCVENLSSEQAAQLNNFQTIRERLIVKDDVTEDMLRDVEDKIDQLLENNNFCLGSIESLKELIDELPNGVEAVEGIVTDSEQDMREKMITSMATYIAYQNEELESLRGQDLSPEIIALSVAVGVEEMHVMNDLNSGRTTVDKAIKVLKIIGGIALFSLLAYVAFNCITAIGTLSMVMFMVAFGSTTIATIGAFLASLFVVWSLTNSAFNAGEKIINWSSRIFDVVVNTWRETVWPSIFAVLHSVKEWFILLFQKKSIVEVQQNEDNVQSVPAM